MKSLTSSLVIVILSFVSGCVSSDVLPIGTQTFVPRPEGHDVEVFISPDAPVEIQKELVASKPLTDIPRNAQEIGRIDTKGDASASWASIVKDAKKKARSIGGDGLIVKRSNQIRSAGAYGGTSYERLLAMTVIRYKP